MKEDNALRQIVLDTETTGLIVEEGHRIIEIGGIELIDRQPTGRTLQQYLDPEREVEPGAQAVNGMSWEQLRGKPRFCDIVEPFLEFIRGAELIIQNAPFDVGFLNAELDRVGPGWGPITDYCTVACTRDLAGQLLPGVHRSLDNLCDHFGIDRGRRATHGALLDAELLTLVYLAMTATEEERCA